MEEQIGYLITIFQRRLAATPMAFFRYLYKMIDWNDTMIYASVGNPPTIFVTDNVKDFPSDYPDYIKTPEEIMKM